MDSNTAIALEIIEEHRRRLIDYINATIDSLENILVGTSGKEGFTHPLELSQNPKVFIGTKPRKMHIGDNIIDVTHWKDIVEYLLKDCCKTKNEAMKKLCGTFAGRKRLILSAEPEKLDKPLKIADNIYFESYFGTEYLLTMLFKILDLSEYDYHAVTVELK